MGSIQLFQDPETNKETDLYDIEFENYYGRVLKENMELNKDYAIITKKLFKHLKSKYEIDYTICR